MKRVVLSIIIILITLLSIAQVPESFNYQAIPYNSNGEVYPNKALRVQTSILTGSPTGSSVYTETFLITTTNLGVLNLQIGKGTLISGNFSAISWGSGLYYLKVEMDPTGGTNFLDMGTTQLLSVPYSMYSKTSGSADYNTLSNLPTFSTVAATGSYSDLSNKPTIDGSETQVIAGNQITVAGSGTAANPYIINSNTHYIGESYGGGIVFYVYDNGQHGLIAATADQSTGIKWCAGINGGNNTMAFADGVGAGKANTAIIIASEGYGDGATYAARICNEYSVTDGGVSYADWYLPSKSELSLLFLQNNVVGGFVSWEYYWSSTESSSTSAWDVGVSPIHPSINAKGSARPYVRAIRAF